MARASASAMQRLLADPQLEFIFVGGKGGVGKTTTSSTLALAASLQRSDKPGDILLVSTDPAHNVSDAFDQQFSSVPQRVAGAEGLWALEIDPGAVMRAEVAEAALDGGAGPADEFMAEFKQWVSSMPGIDEAMALATVLQYMEGEQFRLIIFDTAPTGHTLRLLALPAVLRVGIERLHSWKARLAGVLDTVASFFSRPSSDHPSTATATERLSARLERYKESFEKIAGIFQDTRRTTFVAVCIAEYLSVYETERLVGELDHHGIDCRNIVVNQLIPAVECTNVTHPYVQLCLARRAQQQSYIKTLVAKLAQRGKAQVNIIGLPLLPAEVRGLASLTSFSHELLEPAGEFGSLQAGLQAAFVDTMQLD